VTQHHQENDPVDGRIKKPRHKKFQNQSYGERMSAQPRDDERRDTERGSTERRDTDSRPVKGYRADRSTQPRRQYDDARPSYRRDDRPQYNRDDRPQFSRDERPQYKRDERPQFNRDDRPQYNRDDRQKYERSSSQDKPRFERRDDRPSYDRRDDRGSYQRRDDRPSYQRRDERSSYERRDDRPSYERRERSSYQDKPRYERRDERPVYQEKRREEPVDLGTVAADNQFAALGLAPRLVQRLARDGITTPFPIQAATIPDALAGKDVLGRGQTGSGKTLGFGLPTLTRLAGGHTESRRPRGMILVPTRELAMQVHDALEPLAHVMNVSLKLIAAACRTRSRSSRCAAASTC
jgi:hypothetical protein